MTEITFNPGHLDKFRSYGILGPKQESIDSKVFVSRIIDPNTDPQQTDDIISTLNQETGTRLYHVQLFPNDIEELSNQIEQAKDKLTLDAISYQLELMVNKFGKIASQAEDLKNISQELSLQAEENNFTLSSKSIWYLSQIAAQTKKTYDFVLGNREYIHQKLEEIRLQLEERVINLSQGE